MIVSHSWIYVLGGILCSSLAQIILKRATQLEAREAMWLVYIGGSASCYLISFAAYYMALRHFQISRVSPLMTVGVVLMNKVTGLKVIVF